ncbi:putative spermidine/putrescine transport system permease protein [Variovorax sp. YR752]|uniref:ABC transporter permease n=1 Tax=unclassified Variovorax TaxID=663243 RepID=UPI000BD63AD1|nr:ABC transporter permease [Variovorax sp. YR752]SOE06193.1 putative spermidine/putrescine transport system permease protein [Variovorax sp. YR752]
MSRQLQLGPLRPTGSSASMLLSPSLILVVVLLLGPLVLLGRYSLNRFEPGQFMVAGFTPENYLRFVADPFYRGVLFRTIWISVLSTLICLVLGLLPAYYIARVRSGKVKSLLLILVILPLFMGNAVRVAGWMVLLGDRGLVNAFLSAVGLTDAPVQLLYTGTAVLIGIISVNLPFMIITLQSVIEGIDRPLEEAGLNLGANHFEMFRRVLLPLMMPGVVTGTVLCFILAMNAYATPLLIGGPKFQMMAPAVYDQITRSSNWPFGAALAFVLMVTTLVLTVLSSWLLGRNSPKAAEAHA